MANRNTSSSSSSSFEPQHRIEEEETAISYRSQISPRTSSKTNKSSHSSGILLKPGGQSLAITTIQENRHREKRNLSDLNDRFASYIERVRILEIQNKQIQLQIDHLREKWVSQISKVNETYEVEIREARHVIDTTVKDRAAIDLRAKQAEDEILKFKEKCELILAGRDSDRAKIDLLQKQLTDNEADINLFRRRLNDLEDEQQRYHTQSQKLILDIQRITKELNQEIITRVKLEHEKQSFEDERTFLEEIHSEQMDELKQTNLIGSTLDSTKFFKNELSNAVKNIREEYEQLNHQQRNELELKLTQTLQEIQSHRTIERPEDIREQEEFKKLRILVSDSREDILTMRQRNKELDNRVQELEELIQMEREKNTRASDERDRDIKELRARLENLGRNYDELISTKSSLDSEITIYRKLLEGEENRAGLKQIATHVEETNFSTAGYSNGSSPYSDSRYYQRTGTDQSVGYTAYVPLESATRTEETIFEQVYGNHRRRPTMINLNVQWAPVVNRSNTYQWNRNDINSQKTMTFCSTGAMRQQRQPKAITPPSSDYTDAYLSAFAPKPIPTKHIHRLNSKIFAPVPPISFKSTNTRLSTDNSIRTSETRFNNIQPLNSFDKTMPLSSNRSSTYSSSFIPDISNKHKPYSLPQPQTFNSNYTTTLPQSPSSIYSTTYRSESPHENIFEPIHPCSSESYPASTTSLSSSTTSTHKPFVPLQSAPQPFSFDIDQSSTIKQTVLPFLDIERPETLLFQHDDDIRSSCIDKPSPIISPLLESPIISEEPKHLSMEDLSIASSKPISILENTLDKYDLLINQISEVLASVSPLSSTISNMSPGKSALDYELSSDNSPTLQQERIVSHPSPQSTTTVGNTSTQRIKTRHLIRGDSYDKIVNALADLDTELTPPPDDIQKVTTVVEESDVSLIDEQQVPSVTERVDDETRILSHDGQQVPSITGEGQTQFTSASNIFTNELLPLDETKLDEKLTIGSSSDNVEFIQQQIDLLSKVPSDVAVTEESNASHAKVTFDKKNRKRVTWDEKATDNEDDESSSYQSLVEESSSSEPSSITTAEPQISTPIDADTQIDSPISIEPLIELSTSLNQNILSIDSTENRVDVTDRQSRSSSPSPTSSPFSDSVEQQTASSDLVTSRSNSNDRPTERSITTSNIIIHDHSNKEVEALESTETKSEEIIPIDDYELEFSTQLTEDVQDGSGISPVATCTLSSSPIVISPINTLTDSIATRYISSDVYHGYLGEHKQFTQNISNIDNDNAKKSLLVSLRRTIAASATPLIETIQSVVSSMQTVSAIRPLRNKSEVIDHNRDERRLTTAAETDSTEGTNEDKTQIEENKPTIDDSETIFESLRDATAVPVTTIVTQSSVFDTAQEKVSDTIEICSEEIPDVLLTDVSSTQTYIGDEQLVPSSVSNSLLDKFIDSSLDSIEQISTDTDATVVEQSENSKQDLVESSTSKIPTEVINMQSISSEKAEMPLDDQRTEELPSKEYNNATDNTLSIPTNQDDEQVSIPDVVATEHINIEDIQERVKIDPTSTVTKTSLDTITNPLTTIDEKIDPQTVLTQQITSEFKPTIETDEAFSNDDILDNIIQELIDGIIQSAIFQLKQNKKVPSFKSSLTRPITLMNTENRLSTTINPSIDNLEQQSAKTEIEQIPSKLSLDYRELSPTNTEADSLELIHALRGHRIVLSNSPPLQSTKPLFHPAEKSSSSTTSSQVTSSDRYVSYAIHEMGDSSQERLPVLPIAADLPIYKSPIENIISEPICVVNRLFTKEDDSTELDASENLTSYSDDILLQRLYASTSNRHNHLDTSTTDDDVDDDEFERHDLTNIHQIMDKLTHQNSDISTNEEAYQRYDLATTPSSNDSSPSSKQQTDDVYLIPGYPGLWRPSAHDNGSNSQIDYDADDERKTAAKTRTIVRTSDSAKLQSFFQHHQDEKPNLTHPEDSTDVFNDPFDISEADSFQTCPSKQQDQSEGQHQTSPDEKIFLIREPERGVSLPITMKIDYDNMILRLSTSTPVDVLLHSTAQPDLSSSSTHSEPPLPIITHSNSQASSPSLNSNESDQQKIPSWLNTVNTVTTTTEGSDGPLESRITLLKSAKGPISISKCDPQGAYIMIENTSQSKNIDLSNWTIRQDNNNGDILIFIFPDNCLLTSNHSLKILTKLNESEQKNSDLIASSLSSWHTGPNILTTLINSEGKDRATLTKKTLFS